MRHFGFHITLSIEATGSHHGRCFWFRTVHGGSQAEGNKSDLLVRKSLERAWMDTVAYPCDKGAVLSRPRNIDPGC